jgi:hypothetical protein
MKHNNRTKNSKRSNRAGCTFLRILRFMLAVLIVNIILYFPAPLKAQVYDHSSPSQASGSFTVKIICGGDGHDGKDTVNCNGKDKPGHKGGDDKPGGGTCDKDLNFVFPLCYQSDKALKEIGLSKEKIEEIKGNHGNCQIIIIDPIKDNEYLKGPNYPQGTNQSKCGVDITIIKVY